MLLSTLVIVNNAGMNLVSDREDLFKLVFSFPLDKQVCVCMCVCVVCVWSCMDVRVGL